MWFDVSNPVKTHIIVLKPYTQLKYEAFNVDHGFGKNIKILPEILDWLDEHEIDFDVFWGGFWNTQLCFSRIDEMMFFKLYWT